MDAVPSRTARIDHYQGFRADNHAGNPGGDVPLPPLLRPAEAEQAVHFRAAEGRRHFLPCVCAGDERACFADQRRCSRLQVRLLGRRVLLRQTAEGLRGTAHRPAGKPRVHAPRSEGAHRRGNRIRNRHECAGGVRMSCNCHGKSGVSVTRTSPLHPMHHVREEAYRQGVVAVQRFSPTRTTTATP